MQRKTERKKIFKLKENLSNIIKNGFKYIRDHLSFYSNTPDISNSVGYQEQQEYSPIKKESKNIQKEYFYAVNNSRIYDESWCLCSTFFNFFILFIYFKSPT